MTTAQLDPRVRAANMKAAAYELAQAAFRLECLEVALNDLHQEPPSMKRLGRLYALHFQRTSAEREQRRALDSARRAGLADLQEYPAQLQDGYPCHVFLDGPCVSVFF